MSKICQITGKKAMVGNNVSHSKRRTKRKFDVNLFTKKFYWVEQDCWVSLNISAAGLRTVNKIGLDEAIKKAAKAKGHSCKVEIQGALGIENQLSKKDIDSADLVILANDVGLTKAERFENVPKEKIRKFSPHEIIKKPDIIFE